MYRKQIIVLFILSQVLISSICLAETFKVVFLNPGHPQQNTTGSFWSNVTEFMDAAAQDLDIEITTIYAHRNHILMRSLVGKVIEEQPDYVILVNEKGSALPLLKALTAQRIPVFMLLNSFENPDIELLTMNERRFLRGSIVPNNYDVGKKLMRDLALLYRQLPNAKKHQTINVLALQGDYTTPAALARKSGLMDALSNDKGLMLIDSTTANWSKDTAYLKVKGLLKREQIDVIWTANDAMAFGVNKALKELKLNYPNVVGGVNWDDDSEEIPIDLSYGGHVVLGAYALVVLRDIENGHRKSSNEELTVDIFETSLSPYANLFKQRLRNKNLASYDFSRFCIGVDNKLEFTIEGLSKAYKSIH